MFHPFLTSLEAEWPILEGEGGVVASEEKGEHMGEGFSQLSTVVPCSGLPMAGHWGPSSVFVLGILKDI